MNADETSLFILPHRLLTWALTESNNVSINTSENDKFHISVMCSVTSKYKKLPLFFIGKGKTKRCENSQIGDICEPHFKTHSLNGFMTTQVFKLYLDFLRDLYPTGEKINLILDLFSSHHTDESMAYAKNKNIELFFIPSGYTDILQPLDVAVFAPLKAMVNSTLTHHLCTNPNEIIGMQMACETLVQEWENLPESAIENGWEQYFY